MHAPHRYLLAFVSLLLVAALVWVLAATGDSAHVLPMEAASGRSVPDAAPQRSAPDPTRRIAVDVPTEEAGIRIRGRVLDSYGEPLRGALVGEATSKQPAITTAEGRFELTAGGHAITLLALAAGHAPLWSPQEIQPSALAYDVGDLQLQRGGGIRGQVTDGAGKPLPGATVTLRLQGNATVPMDQLLQPATTDAAGVYAFADLVPGAWRASASAAGMQTRPSGTIAVREGEETAAEPIALAAGHQLAGLVLGPGGQAVAGAQLRLRAGGPNRFDARSESAADGSFRFDALPPGPLHLEVTRQGFLRHDRPDVDPTRGEKLVVQLEGGLRLHGVAVDLATGSAVVQFAATCRRTGDLDPKSNGTMAQQLQRQVDELRAAAAAIGDPQVRAEKIEVAAQLAARLHNLASPQASRQAAPPSDLGQAAPHPEGRFAFEGLEEGLYVIGIGAGHHQYVEAGPFEVRRGTPGPELRIELTAGHFLAGVVLTRPGGSGLGGATVQLMRVIERPQPSPSEAKGRSLYPWMFAEPGPAGVTLLTTRSEADGSFELGPVAEGSCYLSVRHERAADHDTEVRHVHGDERQLRILVGLRANLVGRVANAPLGQAGNVQVLVLGGHGTMRTVKAAADGSWRCEGLQPGGYLVRAFPADAKQYVNRLFGGLFPEHAGGVDPARIPPCDVTLGEGETRAFDVMIDLPPTGVVPGRLSVNGQAGKGARAVLRPVPGEAPGSGGLSLRADCDDAGMFTVRDVPVGNYTLHLTGPGRQELHRRTLSVEAGSNPAVQVDLTAGGLRGRVMAADVAAGEELRGQVWVLPGAGEVPPDLDEYRRDHRVHRVQVRNGAFEERELTTGPAILVVDLRGRNRAATNAVIPAGSVLDLELAAGARQ